MNDEQQERANRSERIDNGLQSSDEPSRLTQSVKQILTRPSHVRRCNALRPSRTTSNIRTTHVRIACYCSINPFVMYSRLCRSQTYGFIVKFLVLSAHDLYAWPRQ